MLLFWIIYGFKKYTCLNLIFESEFKQCTLKLRNSEGKVPLSYYVLGFRYGPEINNESIHQ